MRTAAPMVARTVPTSSPHYVDASEVLRKDNSNFHYNNITLTHFMPSHTRKKKAVELKKKEVA